MRKHETEIQFFDNETTNRTTNMKREKMGEIEKYKHK